MPKSVFSAIENSVSAFLGGAKVMLGEREEGEAIPETEEPRRTISANDSQVRHRLAVYFLAALRYLLAYIAKVCDLRGR